MLEKTGMLGMAKEFIDIQEKIEASDSKMDERFTDVAQAIRDIPKVVIPEQKEIVLPEYPEFPKEIEMSLKGVQVITLKGDKGDTYQLTNTDKKEIASLVKVPVVEKVIEKTETIIEKPIVTNEIKEVAVSDTGSEIVEKVNELPIDDESLKIDFAHIKNAPEFKNGNYYGGSGIKEIIPGANISVDNSNPGYPVVSSTGGSGGGVTSINADTTVAQTLTKGTAGTDFDIVDDGTGDHKFNLPTASATNRGALSSADWSTFNGKQNALTNPVTGTGNTNEIAYFTGASTVSSLAVATYPSLTEISYVKGVTSAIQTQINAKGTGTVTNTGGNLTANAVVLGAGTNDTKVVAGITTDGASQITLGVNATTLGKVKMFGNTSGDATIQPSAVAGTATVITLPASTDTLVGKATTDTLTNKTLTDAQVTVTSPTTLSEGYLGIPQNSKSAAYTTVMADAGKHIYHPSADTTARTFTIDSNANVAYPIGTALTFINDTSAGVITIAITSDTLVLAGAGTTGSRTLAANGIATAVKMTSTRWIINGTGLT